MISKEGYYELFDLAADAMFILDQYRIIREINQIAYRQLGYTKSEMLGKHIDDFVPPDYAALLKDRFATIHNQGCLIDESAMTRKDGSILPVEISNSAIRTDEQKAFFFIARDITSRNLAQDTAEIRNAEEKFQEYERNYHDLMEQAGDAITVADHEGRRYLDVNQAACDLLGYTREEFLTLGLEDFIHPDDLTPTPIRLEQLWSGHVVHAERRLRRKDGSFVDVEMTAKMLADGRLISIKRNITGRKMSEEVMKRHKVIINTTRDGFWLADMKGNLLEANQAYADMSGYSLEELTNMHISQLDALNDRDDVKARIENIAVQGDTIFETQHRRKDGRLFDVEVSVNYMAEQQQFVSFFRDITERKLDEFKFRESEKKWRLLFENMTNGFALHEVICNEPGKVVDYRFLEINPAYEQLTTLKADNIIGRTVLEVLPDTETYWIDVFGRVAMTGEPILYENYSRELERWYQVNAFCPKTGQFAVIVSDITERKNAEMAMSFYQKIINTSRDGFWVVDLSGKLLEVNHIYQDMSGYSNDELINMHFTRLDALDDIEKAQARIEKIIAQGYDLFETKHRHKDGHLFDVEVSVNYMAEQQKFVAFFRDISRRKKNRETLEASLEFSTNLINSMQDGFSVLDNRGHATDANPALCRMTGFSRAELIGTSSPFPYWPPEEYENINDAFQKTLKGEISDFELTFMHKTGRRFPVIVSPSVVRDKKGNIVSYTATVKDISERKLAEEKIEHLAYHDQLTRLPNRTLLLDRLSQALVSSARHGWAGALLFIDLDNFKNLNDTLGHDTGDLLLKEVAHRLESCVREGDTVARLGGDEFVVMLLELNEQTIEAAAQTDTIGEKILAILRKPYQLGHYAHNCTASIGVTLFQGNQQTIDELMKQADITMYQAKKAGRNALRFFDRQMQESIDARVLMETELNHALEKNQFELHYQIQVDDSHQTSGAEALIRWMHPERGMISPAQFIPLAEETGLILPIGLWVLETACTQIKAWQQDKLTRELTIAVNVSAKQFRQVDFVAQVQVAIQRHAINPRLLKLELTESLLQENIDETIAIMNALNEGGVQFSLDDFGTGYSSMQYLKRLPLDQLKIDQSFVRDLATDVSDQAIVRTIIAMAQSLDMEVIAEGVETEEQQQLLLSKGCTRYQGYLFGKPMPIEQFEASLGL